MLIYCGGTKPLAEKFIAANEKIYRRVKVPFCLLVPVVPPVRVVLALVLAVSCFSSCFLVKVTNEEEAAMAFATAAFIDEKDWPM